MKFTNNPDKKKNVYDSVGSAAGQNAGKQKPFPSDVEVPKVPATQQQNVPAQVQQPQAQTRNPMQIDDMVQNILNREDFSFNLNEDALWQQYADQYARMGQMAMMDTMGQAQAMTGGYGNSYAQTVGQQSYQNYMQGLNEAIPDLYQMALDRYMMEGDQMMQQYQLMAEREAIAEEQRRYDQEWAAAHPESSGRGGSPGAGNPNPRTTDEEVPTELDAMHELAAAEGAEAAEAKAKELIDKGLSEDVVWKWYGKYYDTNKVSRQPSTGWHRAIRNTAY